MDGMQAIFSLFRLKKKVCTFHTISRQSAFNISSTGATPDQNLGEKKKRTPSLFATLNSNLVKSETMVVELDCEFQQHSFKLEMGEAGGDQSSILLQKATH